MSDMFDLSVSEEQMPIAARSEVYKILSGIFAYPGTEGSKQFLFRDALERLRLAAPALPYDLPAIDELGYWHADDQEIEVTYASLFDNCTGRPALSLYEKDYSNGDPKQIWEDLIRFYEHFGLNYDARLSKEWPDWIGTELEFLHYLTFLEAAASRPIAAGYLAAEADFLDRHLAKWIPQFSQMLSKTPTPGPYAAYANLLAEFVEADANHSRGRRPAR